MSRFRVKFEESDINWIRYFLPEKSFDVLLIRSIYFLFFRSKTSSNKVSNEDLFYIWQKFTIQNI